MYIHKLIVYKKVNKYARGSGVIIALSRRRASKVVVTGEMYGFLPASGFLRLL
jgi:hypothetical protein